MIELTIPALFAAGLAASPHCGLMCGALQVSQLQTRGRLPLSRALLMLHLGRISGYAVLGALAGSLGQWLLRDLPQAQWGRWIQMAAAVLLVGVGVVQYRGRGHGRCHIPLRHLLQAMPAQLRLYLQGLAWAALPCGVLYSMFGLAALSGSTLFGALLLAAFGLGSLPVLGGSGALVSHAGGLPGLRRMGALALVLMGAVSGVLAVWQPASMAAWCRLY